MWLRRATPGPTTTPPPTIPPAIRPLPSPAMMLWSRWRRSAQRARWQAGPAMARPQLIWPRRGSGSIRPPEVVATAQ